MPQPDPALLVLLLHHVLGLPPLLLTSVQQEQGLEQVAGLIVPEVVPPEWTEHLCNNFFIYHLLTHPSPPCQPFH